MDTIKDRVEERIQEIKDQIRTIEICSLWDESEDKLDNLMAELNRLKEQLND